MRAALYPIAFVLALYLLWGYSYGAPVGTAGDPSSFIKPGDAFVDRNGVLPEGTIVYPGTGFDGQFFFYVGLDPFLTKGYDTMLDFDSYRYSRILLPLLGWFLSFGSPEALKWSLPLVNLGAVLLSTFLLARFLQARGRSPWMALPYPLSIGVVIGWLNDVADPLAASLALAAMVMWLERRVWPAVTLLVLAVFARETLVVLAGGVLIAECLRVRRRAWPFLLPLLAYAGWMLTLRWIFGSNESGVERPGVVPFRGAIDKLGSIVDNDITGTANWELLTVGLMLVTGIYVLVKGGAAIGVVTLRRNRLTDDARLLSVAVAAYGLLILLLSDRLWANPLSYTRYSAVLAVYLVLRYGLTGGRFGAGLSLALVSVSVVNPLFGLVPLEFGPVIEAPGAQPTTDGLGDPPSIAPR